ncbi:helix-turn-helix transcriptional regulator [Blastococcus sp. VKM Ac-2987]|uniref:helix-turn-helix transcriptional regulator n=1 Tax=Blastococcus sp. VKM Ac-2987 TaxID=3004141 RepID=UPI0022AB5120|nr:response regulator transcription factor [Blastococcus sp. VKM Ac-2987]MCZ2860736.1 response regulator transcription factor [Blastococcus sp. VKM Ac-2987]
MSGPTTYPAAWLELVGDILQGRPGTLEFPHADVAELLLRSFDAACCSLNVVDAAWTDHVIGVWPNGYLPTTPPSGELPDATTHPLIRWYSVTGSCEAQILGRVPREVASARMAADWSAFARPFGITHQLALPLRLGDGAQAYVVSRPDDDYHDADAELADLVRPALAALVCQQDLMGGVPNWQIERVRDTRLTEREYAVLRLLGAGLTAQSIARRLHTSPRTVHKHLEHLYRKLGVRDRLVAVQRAREAGLLATPVEPGGRRRIPDVVPPIPLPRSAEHPTVLTTPTIGQGARESAVQVDEGSALPRLGQGAVPDDGR